MNLGRSTVKARGAEADFSRNIGLGDNRVAPIKGV